jgi:multidrug efflux system membrane fusion protein
LRGSLTIPQRSRFRNPRLIGGILCLAVLATGGLVYWLKQGSEPARAAATPARNPVPVSVAMAARQDVPIYLTGLGTVQASYTIGIHAQVDGKLEQVLFSEGQHVKKGEVIAKIDPRLFKAALDQAMAKKQQDQAALIALQKDLKRFTDLASRSFETQQNVDQQQSKVDAMTASIAADDAAIETAQTNLDYTNIVAPSDGRMGVRMVDPGNIVHANDQGSIALLVRTQPTFVLFTLPARTLDDVREAQKRGAVEVTAYDRDNNKVLSKGTLATIDNVIDQTTATYKLKATFANEDERLWPGEFVNARLLLDVRKNVVVIPNSAVQRGPNGLFTWVVKSDKTVEPRPIQTSTMTETQTIVVAGLNDSETVVTGGQYKLQTGAPVSVSSKPVAEGAPL